MRSFKVRKELGRLAGYAKRKSCEDLKSPRRLKTSSKSIPSVGLSLHQLIWTSMHRALVKFHTSPEQSSSVLSALHWSSSSARRTSATQKPTSPALRPTSRAGISLCEACSKLASTSRTVWPRPVPILCQFKRTIIRQERTYRDCTFGMAP
jgi:hypothetical protein